MTIFKASIETRNYEFTAYASSALGAKFTLKDTFINHIRKTGGSYKWAEVQDDVFIEEITLNTGYVR
jgi:hypothetical protein